MSDEKRPFLENFILTRGEAEEYAREQPRDPGAFPEDYAKKLREVEAARNVSPPLTLQGRVKVLEEKHNEFVDFQRTVNTTLVVAVAVALILAVIALCFPPKAHASDVQFSAFVRPALVQTAVDFREVVSWQTRRPTVDFGVRASVPQGLCVSGAFMTTSIPETTVRFPGQLSIGAVTLGKKQTGQTTELTELQIQSKLSTARIEVVPLLFRCPIQPLIVGQHYSLCVSATGKNETQQVVTAEERITQFLPAIGAQLRYPLAYTVCDAKAAVGPRLAFVEAGVSGAVTENLKARLGIRANRARLENVKIDTNAVFASVEWAF